MDFEIRPDHQVPSPADLKRALIACYAWSIAAVVAVLGATSVALFPLFRKLSTSRAQPDEQAPWR